jgi:hypothetical protein
VASAAYAAYDIPAGRRQPGDTQLDFAAAAARSSLSCFNLPLLTRQREKIEGSVSTDKQQRQSAFLTIHKPFRRKRG